MRISDWSSDVCSSDLAGAGLALLPVVIGFELRPDILEHPLIAGTWLVLVGLMMVSRVPTYSFKRLKVPQPYVLPMLVAVGLLVGGLAGYPWRTLRSEEHTSELQSLMRISYAVFCLKKKTQI